MPPVSGHGEESTKFKTESIYIMGQNPNLPIETFSQNVKQAYGAITAPDLSFLCAVEPQQNGTSHWIKTRRIAGSRDSTGAFIQNRATESKVIDANTIQEFEKKTTAEKTWVEFLKLRNVDMSRNEWFTESTPQLIETGTHWDSIEEVLTANDPTSQDMVELAASRFLSYQCQIIKAITDTSTRRRVGNITSEVSLGSFNEIESSKDGYIDVTTDFPTIRGKANLNNINQLIPVWLLVHTNDATAMIQKNWEKIFNKDFVTGEQLRTGNNIPELHGIRVIQTPLIEQGKFYAVVQNAITKVPYKPFESGMWQNNGLKGIFEYWSKESADHKRTDDFGVFHGVIKVASGNAITPNTQAGYAYGTGALVSTITTWTAITKGSLKVEIDGNDYSLTDMDFSSVTDLAGVASVIQTALRTATGSTETVAYDSTNGRIKITSATLGSSSKVDDIKAGVTTSSNVSIKTTLGFSTYKAVLGA